MLREYIFKELDGVLKKSISDNKIENTYYMILKIRDIIKFYINTWKMEDDLLERYDKYVYHKICIFEKNCIKK